VNFYEHHLGDYAKDTAHLSMLEDGAYRRLLDRYYATEQPIAEGQPFRVARAHSRDEKAAVEAVLSEFFKLVDGYWHNDRADEEIAKFRAKQPEAEKRKESDKERQRRARERRKVIYDQLASIGVTMPWNATMDELQDALVRASSRTNNAPVTPPVTRDNTATSPQSPVPSKPLSSGVHSSTDGAPASDDAPPPDALSVRAVELTVMLRQRGAALQASDPHVRAWAETGVTDAQALQALDLAQSRRAEKGSTQAINSGLLNAILGDIRGSPPTTTAGQKRRAPTVHDERRAAGIAIFGNVGQTQEKGDERIIDVTRTAGRAALE